MRLRIRFNPANARRWLLDLRDRLTREGHACDFIAAAPAPEPSAVGVLFALESIIHRLRGPRSSEPIDPSTLFVGDRDNDAAPDLVIDLAGTPTESSERCQHLRVLYDGYAGAAGLLAPLLEGRMPVISVTDAATGAVVVSGAPGNDNAGSVREATEFALARTVTLIAMAVARCKSPRAHQPLSPSVPGPNASAAAAASFLFRSVAHEAVRRLYKLCYYAPHWRIGWRFIPPGAPSVHESLSLTDAEWNILPDPGVRFFADPFPINVGGRHFIFFEDLDHRDQKGVISYVEVDPRGNAGPVRKALEEPWHLSYPFLFEDEGQIWMVPESSADRALHLYRADPFPHRWTRVATLLSGIELSDATLVRHGGRLWMFAASRDGHGSYSDTLSLFSAPKLTGPWTPHPANPVLVDHCAARPAGGFFTREGRLWRPVQDCARGYGTGIGLAEVVRLDETAFDQRLHTVLRPPAGWPGRRLHTLTRYGRLECIDGSAHSPKLPALHGALNTALQGRLGGVSLLASQ